MDALFTFPSTHGAIRGEQTLLEGGLPARVMPLPAQVRAGCGIGLRIPCPLRKKAALLLEERGVELQGVYLRTDRYKPFPLPVFSAALGIGIGDTVSLVGCGGKTATLNRLAMENRDQITLLTTTAKIWPPPDEVTDHRPKSLAELRPGINLVFDREEDGKLAGPPPRLLVPWLAKAGIALVEADGSRGLPLKGWADYEPVIPPETTVTLGICTLGPVGLPFDSDLVHRSEAFARLTGAVPGDAITLDHLAAMLGRPEGMYRRAAGRRLLLINQAERPRDAQMARLLADRLRRYDPAGRIRCFMGSVQNGTIEEIG